MSDDASQPEVPSGRWSEHHVEQLMGTLLRGGVLLAAAVVTIGGLIYLIRHGQSQPEYFKFRGEPEDLKTIGGVLRSAWSLSGRGIIQLGLIVLIATPVARVAFAVLAFCRSGDRFYVVVSLVVLGLLMLSLFGSLGP